MTAFDPRSKNTEYLTRDTDGQLDFISSDASDTFAHHRKDFTYQQPNEGRDERDVTHGRKSTAFHDVYRTTNGIRKFDEPNDYYRDPRPVQ